MNQDASRRPLLAALVTVILWTFAFPASRAALPYFSVEQIVLFRQLVACLFYLLLFIFGAFSLPKVRDIPILIVLGLLGITLYQLFFVFGMGKIAGGAAAMIIAANPVCSSLLARLFLGEKLSPLVWTGIIISLCGIAIIAVIKGTDGEPMGYLALLIAMTTMAIYFVFQKPFFKRYSPLAMTSYTCIGGILPLLIFLPSTIDAIAAAPLLPTLWIIAMGIFSSGIGFILWLYALSKLRAGIVTSFLFLQPLFVSLLSWMWLSEIPETKTFIGGAVVLLGVAMILKEQILPSKGATQVENN